MSPTERMDPDLDGGRGTSRPGGGSRLGDTLRRARQDKGMSVEDLSRKTRLRPTIIRDLEEGRFDALPSQPFVLGYMKLLARQLGLVEKELVGLYNAEAGRGDKGIHFSAPADGSPNRPGKGTILGGLAVFLLLFAAYGANQPGGLSGLWRDLSAGKMPTLWTPAPVTAQAPPPVVKEAPRKETKAPKGAHDAAKETPPVQSPGGEGVLPPMETPAPKVGHTPGSDLPVVAAPPAAEAPPPPREEANEPEPPPVEEPEFSTTAPPAPSAPEEATPPAATAAVAAPPASGKKFMRWEALGLNEDGLAPEGMTPVTIEANRKVWVQIQDNDGNVVKDMVLKEKQRFYIFNGERFNITVGNAAAIALNQKDVNLANLGPEGKVVKMLSLAEESLRKRATAAP